MSHHKDRQMWAYELVMPDGSIVSGLITRERLAEMLREARRSRVELVARGQTGITIGNMFAMRPPRRSTRRDARHQMPRRSWWQRLQKSFYRIGS